MSDPDPNETAMPEIKRTTDTATKPVVPNPFAAEPVVDVVRPILAAQGPSEPSPPTPGFESVPHETAIVLRWTLRDIRGNRSKMSPIDPGHLEALIIMGLVEIRNGEPALTSSGLNVIV